MKLSKARRKRLRLNGSLLRSLRYQSFWIDKDEDKPSHIEELKAYDRYISKLVQRYDLSKVPTRTLQKRLKHLANYLGLHTASQLKTFPHRRWERLYYATIHFKKNKPVEFKKKWLRPVPRKRLTHVHNLSDLQYDFFKTSLKFNQKGQRFSK